MKERGEKGVGTGKQKPRLRCRSDTCDRRGGRKKDWVRKC